MTAQVSALPISAAAAAAAQPMNEAQHTLRRAIATRAHEERQVAGIAERLRRLDQRFLNGWEKDAAPADSR
jgi:hypothetical protein